MECELDAGASCKKQHFYGKEPFPARERMRASSTANAHDYAAVEALRPVMKR